MRGRFRRLPAYKQGRLNATIHTPVKSRELKMQLTQKDGELLLEAGEKSLIFPDYVLEHLSALLGGNAVTAQETPGGSR